MLASPAFAQEHDGEAAFASHCAACHGEGGAGTPGFAPPLASPALWEGLGPDAPDYLAGVILRGLVGTIRSEGQVYAGLMMPPQAQIDDAEIALIADYVLQELGGLEASLDPDTLETLRAEPPSHADLLALRAGSE